MRALIARGWKVCALSPSGAVSDRFAANGVEHIPYRVERAGLNPLKEAAVIAALARLFRDLKPDLVHSFTMKPNIYGALAASWAGIGKHVASVSGLGSFYVGADVSVRTKLVRCVLDRLYAVAMRGVDRVVFENKDDRDELLRLRICQPGQCVVIQGAGVDTRCFSSGERTTDSPVVVTMAARLIRHKGVDEFLSAAEKLKARWGCGVMFQLAGEEDPGNLWAADGARISACARNGVIRHLGFVEDVPALLRGTDIFVLPSYREGMPVSVLEAMSAGLPVVTTYAVGCRDTVIPEESGLLVPVKDPGALAESIDRLIADPGLRRRLGQAAARRAEEVFAIEKIVDAHLRVYRELFPGLP